MVLTVDLDDENVAGEFGVAGVGVEIEVAAEALGNLCEVAGVLEELLGPGSGGVEAALVVVVERLAGGVGRVAV